MIFEPQRYTFIWQDAVHSLAVGFLCGFVNRLLSSFLYKGKIRLFIKDVTVSVFFAVMIFSYAISFANYRVLRWYNVVFALAGTVLFRPGFDRAVHLVFSLADVTIKYIVSLFRHRLNRSLDNYRRKKIEKQQKITQKTETEPLHDNDKVLYN
ncbi:MAG: hypothetical protein IJ410_07435 [Oscillospiraceae bacterium]|nr:hypothetical protein [Oscillospiraceae bacterium]